MECAVLVAPYHPSSNGLAEHAVKTVKQGISKLTEGSLQDKISRFLYSYRLTPHTTTERPPASSRANDGLAVMISIGLSQAAIGKASAREATEAERNS